MRESCSTRRLARPSEEGYILVAVMFMLALLIIALTVAAPKIAKSIQRDREIETMHRGKQYARAVKLYYKQFNAYPPSVDALVKTNEIRFLRKKYVDPTTGKEDWRIIHFGEQKTQTLGFFGQPIGGTVPGAGLNGAAGAAGGSTIGGIGSTGIGTTGTGGIGSGSGSTIGSTSIGSTDPSSGTTSNGSSGDQSGDAGGTNGTGTNSTTAAPGTQNGQNGQTFGGFGIMGFSPNSPKQSILFYKKKNHYNEWEFLYDPIADQMMMQGGNMGAIGAPAGGLNGTSGPGIGGTGIGGTGIGGTGIGTSGTGTTIGGSTNNNGGSDPTSGTNPPLIPVIPQQ